MNDSIRKLIEDSERHRRLKEKLLFPSESMARQLDKLKIAEAASRYPAAIAAVIERTSIAQDLARTNLQLEVAAEQARELATFGVLNSAAMAEAIEGLKRPLVDERTMKALEQAATSLSTRFRFPENADWQALRERMEQAFLPFAALQEKLEAVHSFSAVVEALQTPWIDQLNAARSFDSFAGLAALGTAVRFAPYADWTIETVRDSLGTWTNVPEELEEHSLERETFYREQGLNADLIAIPEPAFTQSLELTGVVSVELLIPDADEVKFESENQGLTREERALVGRIARAAHLMNIFEVKLREFINCAMTQHCGSGWEKGRTPENGKMHARWEQKRQNAINHGEKALGLVHYADFTDYCKLITRRDNWQEVFSFVFRDETDLKVSFKRLEALRLIAMHSRPITKGDLLTIGTETVRILRAIGVLKER